jgi:hypothetical protein
MQISNESIQEHTKSMTAHAMSRSVYGNIYIYIERERERWLKMVQVRMVSFCFSYVLAESCVGRAITRQNASNPMVWDMWDHQ